MTLQSKLLVSDFSMSKFATVGSGDGSLGDSESSHFGGSESGDTGQGLGGASLQVLDRELATYSLKSV